MRAIVYRRNGGPEVLEVVERPDPAPAAGEVLVRVARSGVNPTDWKTRSGATAALAFDEQVPNQDGAGTIVAVGDGVDASRVGERVWLWEAAWQRPIGTAAELTPVPADHAVALPDGADFDLGASIGVPALTAHRALTVAEDAPGQLAAGALDGWRVLVAGGAGAVGHAAIELARWAGATVVTTVSSDEKAALAKAAGATHVVNYRSGDAADQIRAAAAAGPVDVVVEVAPASNAELDRAVLAPGATVAMYANDAAELCLPIRASMTANARYQFVLLYGVPAAAKARAVAGVSAALADGALRTGEQAGLPLHHFPLERTADAHAAVEGGVTGKVLVDVAP
jgi:NADPH2:quinone reductase